MKRVFLVGCPRSGTTLLQSMLFAHSDIFSFPEIGVYRSLIRYPQSPTSGYKYSTLTLFARGIFYAFLEVIKSNKQSRDVVYTFLKRQKREELISMYASSALVPRNKALSFMKLLDKLTLENECSIWVDKTPTNLYIIPLIESCRQASHFIHILRNGLDVVCSLYRLIKEYPNEAWLQGFDNIDFCINYWISAITESKKYIGKKNHYFILYENLMQDPRLQLKQLCNYLNIQYSDDMLSDHHRVARNLILKHEPWKNKNLKSHRHLKRNIHAEIFDQETKTYINNKIRDIDLNIFIMRN